MAAATHHGLEVHQGKDALLVLVDMDKGEGGKAKGQKLGRVRRVVISIPKQAEKIHTA